MSAYKPAPIFLAKSSVAAGVSGVGVLRQAHQLTGLLPDASVLDLRELNSAREVKHALPQTNR